MKVIVVRIIVLTVSKSLIKKTGEAVNNKYENHSYVRKLERETNAINNSAT